MEKREKRKLVRKYLAQQRADARAAFPLLIDSLREMFDYVNQAVGEIGCDHSRLHTETWLKRHKHNVDAVLRWLDEVGGYCDCEVVMNAEAHVNEATSNE